MLVFRSGETGNERLTERGFLVCFREGDSRW